MSDLFKFVTLYRQVDEPQRLEDFFSQTHLPLAEQLPGLVKREISRIQGKPGGESRFYLMVELYFESRLAYERALLSETGRALAQALLPWAEERVVTWFYAGSYEEQVPHAEKAPGN